ncbi:hypothetical protein [Lentzea sp. NPDC004782]|uniref:hypothetical protein n=1 Tax=Lentzea sp. NPDC004782 TaxID=3154458 RepID=UPI00339F2F52
MAQRIEVLMSCGPFTVDGELGLMRSRGIPVVIVRRPPLPAADVVSTVPEALARLS